MQVGSWWGITDKMNKKIERTIYDYNLFEVIDKEVDSIDKKFINCIFTHTGVTITE